LLDPPPQPTSSEAPFSFYLLFVVFSRDTGEFFFTSPYSFFLSFWPVPFSVSLFWSPIYYFLEKTFGYHGMNCSVFPFSQVSQFTLTFLPPLHKSILLTSSPLFLIPLFTQRLVFSFFSLLLTSPKPLHFPSTNPSSFDSAGELAVYWLLSGSEGFFLGQSPRLSFFR